MEPDFTLIMITAVIFAVLLLIFMWARFGLANTVAFAILAGLFTALLDFVSAFVVQNYEYPGQSRLWVFVFVFFGWIGMCGSCLLMAEGVLAKSGFNMLTQRHSGWQVPLLTALIAVVMDLFIDPVAVRAGYWRWHVEGTVYYGIPLLNYVGWFVLMLLAPMGWIWIAKHKHWATWPKIGISLAAIIPLGVVAIILSMLLNAVFSSLGLR